MDSISLFPTDQQEDFQFLYVWIYAQMQKDFHPYFKLEEQPKVLSADQLFEVVKNALSAVIEKQPSALRAIIYRIDLSEKAVFHAMSLTDPGNKLDELGKLILKRLAQKVWLKYNLSKGGS